MKTVNYFALPADEHGTVDYRTPADTYVMKGDLVYAEPGDHVHGYHGPEQVSLIVFADDDCWACRSMAAATRLAQQ